MNHKRCEKIKKLVFKLRKENIKSKSIEDKLQVEIDEIKADMFNERNEIKIALANIKSKYELEKEKLTLENKQITDKLQQNIDDMKVKMRQDQQNAQRTIQLLVDRVNENKTEIDKLGEEMYLLKHANRTVKEEIKTIHDKIDQLINTELKTNGQIQQQFQSSQLRIDEMQQQVQKNDQNMKEKIDQISQQIDSFTRSINQYNKFIWKIDNWSEKLKQAQKSQHGYWIKESDQFESHYHGYKLCLIGLIKQSKVEFYFRIYKGPFDDNLAWPFNRYVQLSIIDQFTGKAYKKLARNYSDQVIIYNKFQKPVHTIPKELVFIGDILLSEISIKTLNNQIITQFCSKPK